MVAPVFAAFLFLANAGTMDQTSFNGMLLGGVATLLGILSTALACVAFFRRQPATGEQLAVQQAFQATITDQLEAISDRLKDGEKEFVRRSELTAAEHRFTQEVQRITRVEETTQDKIVQLTEAVSKGFQDLHRAIGRLEGRIQNLEGKDGRG